MGINTLRQNINFNRTKRPLYVVAVLFLFIFVERCSLLHIHTTLHNIYMISFNIINTFLIEKTKKRGQNLVKNYLKIIIMKNENKKMFF